ncbi:hypothetical protein [Mixta tenebrionis]|uniref:hypothetical protein n=1 Tax=Mixta tenebrionis TaxID=2562439 RepID=UPI003CCC6004
MQVKAGKRALRALWKDKKMYIVRNPDKKNQVVTKNDYLANAGIAIGKSFDYLPCVEICTTDGGYRDKLIWRQQTGF